MLGVRTVITFIYIELYRKSSICVNILFEIASSIYESNSQMSVGWFLAVLLIGQQTQIMPNPAQTRAKAHRPQHLLNPHLVTWWLYTHED